MHDDLSMPHVSGTPPYNSTPAPGTPVVDTLTSRVGIVDEVRGREVRLRAQGEGSAAWTTLRCAVRDAGAQEVRSGRVDLLHGRQGAVRKGGGGWCVVCAEFDAAAVVVGWVESASAAPRGLYACPAHRQQVALPAELGPPPAVEGAQSDTEPSGTEARATAADASIDSGTTGGKAADTTSPADEASTT